MSLKKKKKSKNKTEPSCCGYWGLPARLAGPAQQRTRLGRHKAGAVESLSQRAGPGGGAGEGGGRGRGGSHELSALLPLDLCSIGEASA